jgi:chromosome segregation ATPase
MSEAPPPVDRAELQSALDRIRAGEDEIVRLRAQLDALALDLARREGEMQASGWRLTELERELTLAREEQSRMREELERNDAAVETPVMARMAAVAATPVASASEAAQALARALDEIEALRTALAQEHDARKRLESGDDLARARAAIERQAVLLEQLARDGSRPLSDSGEFLAGSPAKGPPETHEDSR